MRKRQKAIFWGILLAAVAIRLAGFGAIPAGINQDEAMAAVDAWALSKYGTDRFGMFLPAHFEAWGYGQMSVLLSYCMIPFLKVLGFGTVAVRLPQLLASCGSMILMYLVGRKLFSERFALLVMGLVAINPWHFMQSRWSLDCNLFPHVFLLAFYLLLLGLEKRRYLYLSMICFGLTFYCYGIAVYAVIPFLVVYAAWCIWKKQLRVWEVLCCVLVFSVVALPEILVMAVNFFGWHTIETPFFTAGYFPDSVRSNDILFLHFSFGQLWRNVLAMVRTCLIQTPDQIYNALPAFGPMYHISIPFMVLGTALYTKALFVEKDVKVKTGKLALWGFLLTGIWVGLVTYEVNVNRINIIFFPLLFMCGYGIWVIARGFKRIGIGIISAYLLCFGLFLGSYFTDFAREIQTCFNVNFLEAVQEADSLEEYERLYITAHMDWQYNVKMSEILTQYACEIDPGYYQEKTNITGGRKLLPYTQRYHYIDLNYPTETDPEGLYLIHESELGKLSFSYEIVKKLGRYVLLTVGQ